MTCTMGVFKVQDDRKALASSSSSTSSIKPAMVLPEPTYAPPDLKKKPHAKKQPTGHIPRPRNAFILFRCDYVRQKKIPTKVEKDHRNISRIVGQIWRQMNDKQREPWVMMAEEEKMAHSKLYPSFRFATGVSNKKSKRGDDIPHETQKPEDHHFWDNSDLPDLYRSSSCPPGILHVPQANLESCNGYGAPLKTRDDMARRPSRVIVYQSTSHLESTSPPIRQEEFADINNRPGINIHPYPIPGPNDPPDWDVAQMQPHTWTDWSTFQFDQSSSASSGIFGTDANEPFFTDPFLSTLPPLPHACDSHDAFPSVDYTLQQPLTALETEAPSTYSPLERCKLPDAPPEYVQNIAKYHTNTSNDRPIPEQWFS